ncbi:MAG: hypothetical protein ACR2RB_22910 [Gammaproteobacteria bacterium]
MSLELSQIYLDKDQKTALKSLGGPLSTRVREAVALYLDGSQMPDDQLEALDKLSLQAAEDIQLMAESLARTERKLNWALEELERLKGHQAPREHAD